ncbi:16S rRNA (guanine(966)-N(2))-methyltransferase RsmD [Advenella sp. WQ 585]|uniref:16S rRNA (Guanine(966)-N(2))-methyltransferase RsmD n=1 Tax=Advenella mandrilli TaxID=2800330 RepID=A0ABS1EEN4_9BURK|nr:16S rRNA (guanine(966)-N(2))-methyltransferase RsmD [Advenella mandrilli]MBK1781683.1 16S rRNA (guanine(966)-N(2))-methyltransferase RsmD [Advenella mandrilli]
MSTNHQKTAGSPHKIRIIGGQFKRTPIPVADIPGLRPTPDRVRETVFNWINHLWDSDYSVKSVLDLFAGTGALGFEAASRGAGHVQMVEQNRQAMLNLRQLRDKLNVPQVRINSGDAMLVLKRMDASRFDLVFLDPPFEKDLIQEVVPYLPGILKSGSLVYIESEKKTPLDLPFELLKEGKAGAVFYQLYQFIENNI